MCDAERQRIKNSRLIIQNLKMMSAVKLFIKANIFQRVIFGLVAVHYYNKC